MTWLPVDENGVVDPQTLRDELSVHADEVALVTVMWANNEVGSIMPIVELAEISAEFEIPMHSDAVQAVAQLPVDFAASKLSALSIAAHKFGGPHGVGALLLGRQVPCVPLLHGGGHERDLRSGTPDTAGVVGMAAALRANVENFDSSTRELAQLRDRLIDGVWRFFPSRCSTARPDPIGFPVTRTSPSPAARAIRC